MSSNGPKCEELDVSKSSPLRFTKRTSMRGVATSLMGHKRSFVPCEGADTSQLLFATFRG